jgi:D-alanyl-lipoteichoic acid acyltransferase DltB (MBOAT superfamily)
MLFNTFPFAIFYVVVVLLFFALPHRFRWVLLLAASYFFYMWWSVPYIAVIIGLTLIDYVAAIRIEQAVGRRRRVYLWLSLLANFGLLFVFKYANFFATSLGATPLLHLLLPVGISFHTFQAVSYTVDVYRGRIPAERHLGMYALYVAFFPQMVAGPIERAGRLLPQFREPKRLDYQRVRSGLGLALRGLIKKAVIADLAAPAVNQVYGHPRDFPAPMLLLATILFSAQIYCDFSGYSDMAVGLARVLGYDLTINFRQPWRARSMEEFWHRWHISLSEWFRDYVYVPLGGNRVPAWRWAVNILVVFLLSGLWHGANWTFVVWGAIHGMYLLVGRWTGRRAGHWTGMLTTNALVTLAWVFFRANNLSEAFYIAGHMFRFGGFTPGQVWNLGLPRFEMTFLLLALPCLVAGEYLAADYLRQPRAVRWCLSAAGIYAVVFFGIFERIDFIYFRF